ELLALLHPIESVIECPCRDPHGASAGPDTLAVVRVHEIGKPALESGGRHDGHTVFHEEILEQDFAFGHSAKTHRGFAPGHADRAAVVANREEAADTEILSAFIENARKNQVQSRNSSARNPMLLSIDHIAAVLAISPCRHCKSVAAGLGFRDADCRLVSGDDQFCSQLLLRLRAE